MDEALTYTLLPDESNSQRYYRDISTLADRWQAEIEPSIRGIVDDMLEFRRRAGLGARSFDELALELLALGVGLREHGGQAAGFPEWAAQVLAGLIARQEERPQASRLIKGLRGVVDGLGAKLGNGSGPGSLDALALARSAGIPLRLGEEPDVGCTLYLRRLIAWLQMHGHTAQANRFMEWQSYIESFEPQQSQEIILQSLALAQDFALQSAPVLDRYTRGVEEFIREARPAVKWRYDAELVTRSPLEYHLGMLGVEVLTRLYRQDFLKARRKIVILPACMCALPGPAGSGDRCQAQETPLGRVCQACTPACKVNQICRLGQPAGFEVYIRPHGANCTSLRPYAGLQDSGLVGIACVLTAWEAGLEVERGSLPAQGMLLDYAARCDHWAFESTAEAPIVTGANLDKLREILGLATPGPAEG